MRTSNYFVWSVQLIHRSCKRTFVSFNSTKWVGRECRWSTCRAERLPRIHTSAFCLNRVKCSCISGAFLRQTPALWLSKIRRSEAVNYTCMLSVHQFLPTVPSCWRNCSGPVWRCLGPRCKRANSTIQSHLHQIQHSRIATWTGRRMLQWPSSPWPRHRRGDVAEDQKAWPIARLATGNSNRRPPSDSVPGRHPSASTATPAGLHWSWHMPGL